jgi:hypothetical protein
LESKGVDVIHGMD